MSAPLKVSPKDLGLSTGFSLGPDSRVDRQFQEERKNYQVREPLNSWKDGATDLAASADTAVKNLSPTLGAIGEEAAKNGDWETAAKANQLKIRLEDLAAKLKASADELKEAVDDALENLDNAFSVEEFWGKSSADLPDRLEALFKEHNLNAEELEQLIGITLLFIINNVRACNYELKDWCENRARAECPPHKVPVIPCRYVDENGHPWPTGLPDDGGGGGGGGADPQAPTVEDIPSEYEDGIIVSDDEGNISEVHFDDGRTIVHREDGSREWRDENGQLVRVDLPTGYSWYKHPGPVETEPPAGYPPDQNGFESPDGTCIGEGSGVCGQDAARPPAVKAADSKPPVQPEASERVAGTPAPLPTPGRLPTVPESSLKDDEKPRGSLLQPPPLSPDRSKPSATQPSAVGSRDIDQLGPVGIGQPGPKHPDGIALQGDRRSPGNQQPRPPAGPVHSPSGAKGENATLGISRRPLRLKHTLADEALRQESFENILKKLYSVRSHLLGEYHRAFDPAAGAWHARMTYEEEYRKHGRRSSRTLAAAASFSHLVHIDWRSWVAFRLEHEIGRVENHIKLLEKLESQGRLTWQELREMRAEVEHLEEWASTLARKASVAISTIEASEFARLKLVQAWGALGVYFSGVESVWEWVKAVVKNLSPFDDQQFMGAPPKYDRQHGLELVAFEAANEVRRTPTTRFRDIRGASPATMRKLDKQLSDFKKSTARFKKDVTKRSSRELRRIELHTGLIGLAEVSALFVSVFGGPVILEKARSAYAKSLRAASRVRRGTRIVAGSDVGRALRHRVRRMFERVIRAFRAALAAGKRSGGSRGELLDELRRKGVRHTPEDIVRIGRDTQGRVIFLEKGNPSAGLEHIELRHAQDFANTGITRAEIPDLVMQAATRGREVGITGKARPVFEVEFKGRTRRVAVEIGDNGFVVGSNPVSMSRRLK